MFTTSIRVLSVATVLFLAACGEEPTGEPSTAVTPPPTETAQPVAVSIAPQWDPVITGAGWQCKGSIGFTLSAAADSLSGAWSCINDSSLSAARSHAGSITGVVNGSAITLQLGEGWPDNPAHTVATMTGTISSTEIRGTVDFGTGPATFVATLAK